MTLFSRKSWTCPKCRAKLTAATQKELDQLKDAHKVLCTGPQK